MGGVLVAHEPTSAGLVRSQLAAELTRLQLDSECIDEILLVATELVGNAVRHAVGLPTDILDVTWSLGPGSLTVAVADGSTEPPRPRHAAPHATSGRGLRIVEALADEWGVTSTPGGKTVWARMPVRLAS